MVTYEEIGRRIRQAREAKGLLQADLGRRMARPRSHSAISDIERGKTRLDVEELTELARLLDTQLSDLLSTRSPEGVVYLRSDAKMTREQHGERARAVEAFKTKARTVARQGKSDPG